MKRLWSLGLGILFVAGSAGAQANIDYANRIITANAAATIPATAGQTQVANGSITGSLNISQLDQSETAHIIYHLAFGSLQVFGTDLTCINECLDAAEASVWFDGSTNDIVLVSNGLSDGYGYELGTGPTADFTSDPWFNLAPGSTSINYTMSAYASAFLSDLGNGASGSATASIRLIGADAVNSFGYVTSSAVFDQSGNGYFAASTPEPSSLALLGTGLLGVIPMYRRRRQA